MNDEMKPKASSAKLWIFAIVILAAILLICYAVYYYVGRAAAYSGDAAGDSKAILFTYISVFAIGLVCYIVSRVCFKESLVITANVFDKICILVSPILLIVASIAREQNPDSSFGRVCLIICLVLAGISILLSIISNLHNPIFIVLSVMSKVFIYIAVLFVAMLLFAILIFSIFSRNEDNDWHVVGYDERLNIFIGYRKA